MEKRVLNTESLYLSLKAQEWNLAHLKACEEPKLNVSQ